VGVTYPCHDIPAGWLAELHHELTIALLSQTTRALEIPLTSILTTDTDVKSTMDTIQNHPITQNVTNGEVRK